MARNRNRNSRNRSDTTTNIDQSISQSSTTSKEEKEAIVNEEQNIEDTTKSEDSESDKAEVSEQKLSETEDSIISSDDFVVPSTEDSPNVAKLKEILKELKDALGGFGKTPEEFTHAAQLSATLVRYVIANYKSDVLDALLEFYEENLDGVCRPTEFLKGSTTLSATEEQQLGLINHLFYQLATKRFVRVNNAHVVNVLKRPEISNYFQRKMAGIKANR